MANKNPSPSTRFKPGVSGFEGRKHDYLKKRNIAENLLPLAGKVLKYYLENGNSREQLISVGIVFKYGLGVPDKATINLSSDGQPTGASFTINGVDLKIPFSEDISPKVEDSEENLQVDILDEF